MTTNTPINIIINGVTKVTIMLCPRLWLKYINLSMMNQSSFIFTLR